MLFIFDEENYVKKFLALPSVKLRKCESEECGKTPVLVLVLIFHLAKLLPDETKGKFKPISYCLYLESVVIILIEKASSN